VNRRTIQLFKDGNQWCALEGENLQEGTAGFGTSPSEALIQLAEAIALHADKHTTCSNCEQMREL
jgi:hypothetical protein